MRREIRGPFHVAPPSACEGERRLEWALLQGDSAFVAHLRAPSPDEPSIVAVARRRIAGVVPVGDAVRSARTTSTTDPLAG